MTTKTEAERRLAAYNAWAAKNNVVLYADATRALFQAIFDPLPPEPEPEPEAVKSLGQILWEVDLPEDFVKWEQVDNREKLRVEERAKKIAAAFEARRPKPTVEDVARALSGVSPYENPWDEASGEYRESYLRYARAVFPLFGVTP